MTLVKKERNRPEAFSNVVEIRERKDTVAMLNAPTSLSLSSLAGLGSP